MPGRKVAIGGHVVLPFLLAASSFIYLARIGEVAVGRLYVSEALAALIVLLHPLSRQPRRPWPYRAFFPLAVLWLVMTLISNLTHGAEGLQAARGVANVTALLIDLLAMRLLLTAGRGVAVVSMACGFVLAGAGSVWLLPDRNTLLDPWKFGLAFPLTVLLCLAVARLRRGHAALLIAAAGLLHLYLGSRGLGATCLIAAVALPMWGPRPERPGRPASGPPTPPPRTGSPAARWGTRLAGGLVLAGALFLVSSSYAYLAGDGHLGRAAERKYEMQAGGALGVIGGGRKEMFFDLVAVSQSPLLGLGAEPKLTSDIVDGGLELMDALGYTFTAYDRYRLLSTDTLPIHSTLMQGWIQAGLAGAIFWVYVLVLVARRLLAAIEGWQLTALEAVLSISLIWAILFSPIGANIRLSIAFCLVTVLIGAAGRPRPEEGTEAQPVATTG